MSILVAGEGLVFHYRLINRNRAAGCGAGKRRQLLILAGLHSVRIAAWSEAIM